MKYLGGFGLGKLRIINAENDELDHEACNKRYPEESSSPGSAIDNRSTINDQQSNYMFRMYQNGKNEVGLLKRSPLTFILKSVLMNLFWLV